MKAVVFYESAADLVQKAPLHAAAHRVRWLEFADRGELLMVGPFANARAFRMAETGDRYTEVPSHVLCLRLSVTIR